MTTKISVKCLLLNFLIAVLAAQFSAQENPKIKAPKPAEFQGDPETGKKYTAAIENDNDPLSFQPIERLKLPRHHAGRIEWTNLEGLGMMYPLSTSRKIEFVFELISKETTFSTAGRWNTTYFCRILEIKTESKNLATNSYKAFIFVGRCKSLRATDKRHQSYIFNFEILRVVAGGENIADQSKIVFERFAGLGGDYLLSQIEANQDGLNLDSEKEVEVTLLYPANEKINK